MKTTPTFILFLLTLALYAQDISGQWNGALNIQGTQIRLSFNIEKKPNGYVSTLDSPDQGAFGIPVTSTQFNNSKLQIKVKNLAIIYNGVLQEKDSIIGSFTQGGHTFPLNLSRDEVNIKAPQRPQEPSPPYPYDTADER